MARKTSLKINTGPIVTIFDCPIVFAFYVLGKVRYKWICVRHVKLNRWFSRYVIAAMLVDENKRFLISSFCSSTSNCTLQHCYLCPWRLVANHLYSELEICDFSQVVIKTVNEVISRCCFAEDGTALLISACCMCSTLMFTRSTNQILNLWRCRCRSRH